ncbi:MAG: ankyrin repeat-containing domain protein [Monoraphidium minutum]|nr:MAG: ankyrin repeat-containing domain protein [Monoraphidium minutum]
MPVSTPNRVHSGLSWRHAGRRAARRCLLPGDQGAAGGRQRGNEAAVARLLEEGAADPNGHMGGDTPLMIACITKCPGVVGLLLADPRVDVEEMTTDNGQRAAHFAAACCVPALRPLLAKGADLRARDWHGATPLMEAGSAGAVEALLAAAGPGALTDADVCGRTALHCAAFFGKRGVAEALLAAAGPGALAACDKDGQTALHCAAWWGERKVVEALLAAAGPAPLDHPDKDGQTALHCATRNGKRDAAEALRRRREEVQVAWLRQRLRDQAEAAAKAAGAGAAAAVRAVMVELGAAAPSSGAPGIGGGAADPDAAAAGAQTGSSMHTGSAAAVLAALQWQRQ